MRTAVAVDVQIAAYKFRAVREGDDISKIDGHMTAARN